MLYQMIAFSIFLRICRVYLMELIHNSVLILIIICNGYDI